MVALTLLSGLLSLPFVIADESADGGKAMSCGADDSSCDSLCKVEDKCCPSENLMMKGGEWMCCEGEVKSDNGKQMCTKKLIPKMMPCGPEDESCDSYCKIEDKCCPSDHLMMKPDFTYMCCEGVVESDNGKQVCTFAKEDMPEMMPCGAEDDSCDSYCKIEDKCCPSENLMMKGSDYMCCEGEVKSDNGKQVCTKAVLKPKMMPCGADDDSCDSFCKIEDKCCPSENLMMKGGEYMCCEGVVESDDGKQVCTFKKDDEEDKPKMMPCGADDDSCDSYCKIEDKCCPSDHLMMKGGEYMCCEGVVESDDGKQVCTFKKDDEDDKPKVWPCGAEDDSCDSYCKIMDKCCPSENLMMKGSDWMCCEGVVESDDGKQVCTMEKKPKIMPCGADDDSCDSLCKIDDMCCPSENLMMKGSDWMCCEGVVESDDGKQVCTFKKDEPEYKCVGEISSKEEECGKIKNKDECEKAFKSPFSDGLCDWIPVGDCSIYDEPCKCTGECGWSSSSGKCEDASESQTDCGECPVMDRMTIARETFGTWSCVHTGCVESGCPMEYDPKRGCQCNEECEQYGNCCDDAGQCKADPCENNNNKRLACKKNKGMPENVICKYKKSGMCVMDEAAMAPTPENPKKFCKEAEKKKGCKEASKILKAKKLGKCAWNKSKKKCLLKE